MRIFVIVLLILLICFLFFRSWRAGEKPSWIPVALVLAPTLFLSWGEYNWQSNQNLGTHVVKVVSENPEGVLKCQRFSEALLDASVATKGFVYFSEPNVATVKYNTCQDLFGWFASSRQSASLREAQAIGVLIHEAVHVSGEFNEAITECISMRKMVNVLLILNVEEGNAQTIADMYRNEIHPRLAAEYRGGEC